MFNFEKGDSVEFVSWSKYHSKFGTYIGSRDDDNTRAKIRLHDGCGGDVVYSSYDSIISRKVPEVQQCKFNVGDCVSLHTFSKYGECEGVFTGMDDMFAKVEIDDYNFTIYVNPEMLKEIIQT